MKADKTDFDVLVLGSANVDHLIRVPSFPQPGETIAAEAHTLAMGGKGANQALAAVRSGARVVFVGSVGHDDGGASLLATMNDEGIDVSHVANADVPTGNAFVIVDRAGMNQIVIAAGANACLKPPEQLPDAPVLLVQLEIPVETVRSAMQAFRGIVVLNPAPSGLARDLIQLADVIVPNAVELADLASADTIPSGPKDALSLVRQLGSEGVVVVTLGSAGALVVLGEDAWHLAAPAVDVVDTTGAGDAFCGALAARLARGDTILQAVRWGVAAGTAAVTRPGAGPAMPTASDAAVYLQQVTTSRSSGQGSCPVGFDGTNPYLYRQLRPPRSGES